MSKSSVVFISLHVWEGSAVTNCCIQSLEGLFLRRSFDKRGSGEREREREKVGGRRDNTKTNIIMYHLLGHPVSLRCL